MNFKDFLEAGTQGEGPNASGQRGANPIKPATPQKGGSINPEPGKKEILGGSFGGGGPKKSTETPASPLSPRGSKTKWDKTPVSPYSPAGFGMPPGPPQAVPPSNFVSRYMSWQPPKNAVKNAGWPIHTEKSSKQN